MRNVITVNFSIICSAMVDMVRPKPKFSVFAAHAWDSVDVSYKAALDRKLKP